jgi:hypothetical protein
MRFIDTEFLNVELVRIPDVFYPLKAHLDEFVLAGLVHQVMVARDDRVKARHIDERDLIRGIYRVKESLLFGKKLVLEVFVINDTVDEQDVLAEFEFFLDDRKALRSVSGVTEYTDIRGVVTLQSILINARLRVVLKLLSVEDRIGLTKVVEELHEVEARARKHNEPLPKYDLIASDQGITIFLHQRSTNLGNSLCLLELPSR